jgi:hypothetical protein
MWVDASHHNAMDLPAYFGYHDRLAHKVTEGIGYVDPMFATRYAYARTHGHPFAGYHFDRARWSGTEQWDFFEQTIRAAGGPRPYPLDLWVLDSEDTNYPRGAKASLLGFTGRAVQRGFADGAIYSGLWYAVPNGIRLDLVAGGWRRGWLSDYGSAADEEIALPPGWRREQVIARQYTNLETTAGVVGRCDGNRTLHDWLTEADMDKIEHDWLAKVRELVADVNHDVHDVLLNWRLEVTAELAALRAKLDALAAATGADPVVLAVAVNDELARRVQPDAGRARAQ